MLQVALTGQCHHACEPSKVLAGLNQALCGKFTQNFVTAAYIYFDLENQLIRYAGAGHPPLLQCRDSAGTAFQIVENGLVLGMFEEATYESLELLWNRVTAICSTPTEYWKQRILCRNSLE